MLLWEQEDLSAMLQTDLVHTFWNLIRAGFPELVHCTGTNTDLSLIFISLNARGLVRKSLF